jgi:uncharacterized protein
MARHAVARSLFPATSLMDAVARLGFVQLDPIRAPARAQDLILRHRVDAYRVGDIDRGYPELPLAEDRVHVYGLVPRAALRWLHPRERAYAWRVEREHPQLATRILDHVAKHGPTHPAALQRALALGRMTNAWGGQSAIGTRMLEALHYRGHLEVVRRERGVRIFGLASPMPKPLSPRTRATAILRLLVSLYAPLPQATLRQLARMITPSSLPEHERAGAMERLLRSAWLACREVDGLRYLWPRGEIVPGECADDVRLLAPFDPLVWDRRRFRHLWQWDYRFEAYTPAARRRLGYYALPLLWRSEVIGWANVAVKAGTLDVATGFARPAPRGIAFRRAFDAEIARFEAMLLPRPDAGALEVPARAAQ